MGHKKPTIPIAFRRTFFVDPIIRAILKKTEASTALTEEEEEEPNL